MLLTIACVVLARLAFGSGLAAYARHGAGDVAGAAAYTLATLALLGAIVWVVRPLVVTARLASQAPRAARPRPTARP